MTLHKKCYGIFTGMVCGVSLLHIVLSISVGIVTCVQMEKALVSLALKKEDEAAVSEGASPQMTAPSPVHATPVPSALKGVSQSLLARVRTLLDGRYKDV